MRTAISIDVGAPADLVFGLARDVERWPDLLPHYVRVRRLARLDGRAGRNGRDGRDGGAPDALRLEMVARRALPGPLGLLGFAVPLAWRSRMWAEPHARRLRFVHEGGATDGMDVTWRIEPTADAARCRVTIEHVFERRASAVPALLDRFVTRPVAGRTLATFKAIAEAVHESAAPIPTKGPA